MFAKTLTSIFIFALILFDAVFCQARQKATLLLEHEQKSPWIDLLYKGLEKGAKAFDFKIRVVIAEKASDRTDIFRRAASESDLVLVATDNFHEILRDNAANFRRVKFGCLDAGIRAPNIMSITFADEQASFLAGLAAAMFSEQNAAKRNAPAIAGWLSGEDSPAIRSLANGFAEGIKLGGSDCKFAQAITNSFTDEDLAKQKAQWLMDKGANIIALAAGAANQNVLPGLETKQIWHIAIDGYLLPAKSLGLVSKKTDQAVYEIMESAASPKYAGKEIRIYDLANGGVDFELSEAVLKDPSLKNIVRRVKEVKAEILKGSIIIPSLRARTLCDCLD